MSLSPASIEVHAVCVGIHPDRDCPTSLDVKLAAAKQYLGKSYMLHPEYQFRERHAFSVVRWAPHSILRPVQMAAQQAGRI